MWTSDALRCSRRVDCHLERAMKAVARIYDGYNAGQFDAGEPVENGSSRIWYWETAGSEVSPYGQDCSEEHIVDADEDDGPTAKVNGTTANTS